MSWHSFRIATSFCLVLTGGAQWLPAQTKPMNVDRAIKLFAGLEREYKVLEWTLQIDRSQLKDAGDLSSVIPIAESPYLVSEVRFDPHSRRYIVEEQSVTTWEKTEGAPTAFIAIFESRGFDGKVHRSWSQEKQVESLKAAHLELAKLAPKTGLIMDHQYDSGDCVNDRALAFGFGLMPPYVFDYDQPPMPLSKMLEYRQNHGSKPEVTEDGAGYVNVTYPVRYKSMSADEPPGTFAGTFDVNKGGVCLGWTITFGEGSKKVVFRRCEFENFEAAPGLWAPRQIALVEPQEKPPCVTKLTLTKVRVNPPADAKVFVLKFPVGTQVDDYFDNKFFTVTSEAIDEQAAVKAFIARHGVKAFLRTNRGLMWVTVAGVACLVLIGGWAWSRWRRSA